MNEFDQIVKTMHRLRNECPWDKEQTSQSLRKNILEEAYECVTAIDELESAGTEPLMEELGDVLLQVLFHAEILKEKTGKEAIKEIITKLNDKLVYRHPHVFKQKNKMSSEAALRQWEDLKRAEKGTEWSSLLDGLAKGLTSLQLSQKIGKRSEKIKFDWESSKDVWEQMTSEIQELKEAKSIEDKEHEFGDVLFSLVQWARHEKIDAETALAKANSRFKRRFMKMEEIAKEEKKEFENLPLNEKEELWKKAKAELRAQQ